MVVAPETMSFLSARLSRFVFPEFGSIRAVQLAVICIEGGGLLFATVGTPGNELSPASAGLFHV